MNTNTPGPPAPFLPNTDRKKRKTEGVEIDRATVRVGGWCNLNAGASLKSSIHLFRFAALPGQAVCWPIAEVQFGLNEGRDRDWWHGATWSTPTARGDNDPTAYGAVRGLGLRACLELIDEDLRGRGFIVAPFQDAMLLELGIETESTKG